MRHWPTRHFKAASVINTRERQKKLHGHVFSTCWLQFSHIFVHAVAGDDDDDDGNDSNDNNDDDNDDSDHDSDSDNDDNNNSNNDDHRHLDTSVLARESSARPLKAVL